MHTERLICSCEICMNLSMRRFHSYPAAVDYSLEANLKLIWPSSRLKEKRFPDKQPHLSVSLDLRVNKSPQNVGCDWKVDEDKLRLLVKAEQGEVVTQLHRLNGVFLLLSEQ